MIRWLIAFVLVFPLAAFAAQTTTDSGDSIATRGLSDFAGGGVTEFEAAFFNITMPDMTGDTVTDAVLNVNVGSNFGGAASINVYAIAEADSGSWDAASTGATLNGLSYGTAVSTSLSLGTGTGAEEINIFGDSGAGVSKFYDDYPAGGDITIVLEWTTAVSGSDGDSIVAVGDDDSGPYHQFSPYNHASLFPNVTVTYTEGGGGGGTDLTQFFLFFAMAPVALWRLSTWLRF